MFNFVFLCPKRLSSAGWRGKREYPRGTLQAQGRKPTYSTHLRESISTFFISIFLSFVAILFFKRNVDIFLFFLFFLNEIQLTHKYTKFGIYESNWYKGSNFQKNDNEVHVMSVRPSPFALITRQHSFF